MLVCGNMVEFILYYIYMVIYIYQQGRIQDFQKGGARPSVEKGGPGGAQSEKGGAQGGPALKQRKKGPQGPLK